ncbi:MAG: hypothetical protein HGA45_02735 [Chloroflexales bacterium]|nr:hypothetical protein [Chloroflexales bacterium]
MRCAPRVLCIGGALAALVLLLATVGITTVSAQSGQRCFPETGACIEGPIRDYWERSGGLPVFGYPISPRVYVEVEGQRLEAQWFERDRLEDHGAQGVMAGRLGAQLLEWQGTPWQGLPQADRAAPGCRFFPETRHALCEPYLSYWEQQGGLTRFGYPISEPMTESVGNWYGGAQYFERRRMEYHPEFAGTPYEVLLGLLGRTLADIQHSSVCPFAVPPEWRAVYSRISFRSDLGCPDTGARTVPSAHQGFEGGEMIWLDLGAAGRKIYVLPAQTPGVEAGQAPWMYQVFDDTWAEGQPVDSSATPPDGLMEPQRGFGKLWREHPEVQAQLGWATTPELAGTADWQPWFSSGALFAIPYATDDPHHGFFYAYGMAPDGRAERVNR